MNTKLLFILVLFILGLTFSSCTKEKKDFSEQELSSLIADPDFTHFLSSYHQYTHKLNVELSDGLRYEKAANKHHAFNIEMKRDLNQLEAKYPDLKKMMHALKNKKFEKGTAEQKVAGCFSVRYGFCMSNCALAYGLCLAGASSSRDLAKCGVDNTSCKEACNTIYCNER